MPNNLFSPLLTQPQANSMEPSLHIEIKYSKTERRKERQPLLTQLHPPELMPSEPLL
jgi:hypothetical protein